MKSEMIEIKAWDIMILCNWAFVKQVPDFCLSHALDTGLHCKIHRRVKTIFVTTRTIMAPWIGRMKCFSTGMRSKKKQMDILVNINVWNVWIQFA